VTKIENAVCVLVVEDDPVNREVTRAMLARLGARVTLVEDGGQALQALRDGRYDLVLMDCQMPVLDGYQATARIRAAESGTRTPIIALTADALAEDRQRCLEAGMDDYIAKPVTVENLARMLSRWAASAQGRRVAGTAPMNEPAPVSPAANAVPSDSSRALDAKTIESLRALAGVEASDFLPRVIGVFLTNSRAALADAGDAIAAGDCPSLHRLAHKLKSSSRYLGAKRLAELCAELEQAATRSDAQACARLARQMLQEFGRAEAEFEAYLSSKNPQPPH